MNSTPSAVLSRFLLGSELVDTFTFDEFKSFFPSKYSTPEAIEEIRKLHNAHNARRRDSRNAVKKSIKMKCKEVDKVIKRRKMRKDNPVYNHSLAECNGFLYDLIKKQERDLKELNDHIDSLRDELNTFNKELAKVDLDHVSDPKEYKKNIEQLVKTLQ